jgi:hypothetical protein
MWNIRQIDHFLASNLRHLRTGSGFSSATGSGLTNIFGAPAAMTLTTRNHSHASQTQVCKTPKGMFFFAGWSKKHRLNLYRLGSRNGPPAPLGPRAPRLLFSLPVVDLASKSFPNALSKVLQKDSVSTRRHLVCQCRPVLHTYHNVGLVHGPEQKPFQRDQDQIHPPISPSSTPAGSQDWGPGRGHCSGGKRGFFVDCHFRAGSRFVVKATTTIFRCPKRI